MSRVFLTGCGSGFGLAMARAFLRRGDVVVGTERVLDGVRDRVLEGLADASDRLALRVLELSEADSIAAATADAGPVDILVNNAGYAYFASQDEADLGAVRRLFEVNVFGLSAVTAALLPSLRAQRGTVVQLSSVAGRMVFPESGFYAATKHAVEALSEALYLENRTAGLRVVVVEPGSFDTGFLARALQESPEREESSHHAVDYPTWDAAKFGVLADPQSPALVAQTVLAALGRDAGFQRVVAGTDAEAILSLRESLGDDWMALMGARNGGDDVLGTLPSAAEVLASDEATVRRLWPAALLAARSGHLDHWAHNDSTAGALQRLLGWSTNG